MTDDDTIERRLDAVERAVSDGETDLGDLATAKGRETRLDAIEDRLADLEATVDDLDAATQSLRGYVGNIRSVNRDVERRAESALAAVERLEAGLDDPDGESDSDRSKYWRTGPVGDQPTLDPSGHSESPHGRRNRRGHPAERDSASTEMPVPGADERRRNAPETERGPDQESDRASVTPYRHTESDDGGLLDRVRDAL
jgi:hypothetical protein